MWELSSPGEAAKAEVMPTYFFAWTQHSRKGIGGLLLGYGSRLAYGCYFQRHRLGQPVWLGMVGGGVNRQQRGVRLRPLFFVGER